jgi:hypothetical protein
LASGSLFETQSVLERFLPLRFRSRRAKFSARPLLRPARDPFELQVEQVVNPRRLRKPAGDLRSVTGDGRRAIVKRESTDRV